MNKAIIGVLFSLWLAGCASIAAQARADYEADEADEEEECEVEATVGTRIKRRVCRSAQQRAEDRRAAQDALGQMQKSGGRLPSD